MKIARIVYLSMVHFRLLRLFMFIQKMDVWLSVSVYEKFFATLLCASYMSENQQRSRAKIIWIFFNFCPTINDADSDIYLRTIKLQRIFRRRTQRARRPFMNVHKLKV